MNTYKMRKVVSQEGMERGHRRLILECGHMVRPHYNSAHLQMLGVNGSKVRCFKCAQTVIH